MGKKEILFNFLFALIFTLASLWFVADNTVFGSMKTGVADMGFPFHYLEIINTKSIHKTNFLPFWFIGNLVWYMVISLSVWYLLKLVFKQKRWLPLVISVALGISAFWINLSDNNACVTGFPIEFYLKCTADGHIGTGYLWAGYIINPLFWITLSAVVVAIVHWFYTHQSIKQFLLNKNIFWTVFGIWVVFVLITLLDIVGDFENGGGVVDAMGAVGGVFALNRLRKFYKHSLEQGKRLFFSRLGYISLGISIGLVAVSTIFNLFYQGGWFDFTDLGFALISYPLSSLVHVEFDNQILSQKLALYGFAIINLILVTYILDFLGYLTLRIVRFFWNAER